ncbi:MAG: urea ABC transporter permease subunit UrtB [Gammaproteobacteria bacterium]|nr:urea ABC transporter permease subunit UrtB [Gammaproteobacteria bacterium]
MPRILSTWFALILLMLCGGAATAAVPDAGLTSEQLEQLGERNLRVVETAVADIAASGSPVALEVLQALQDGRLYRRQADGVTLVATRVGGVLVYSDPLIGTLGEPLADADVTLIRVSNRIRRALSAAIASLSLDSEDPAVRLAAARQFIDSPDSDLLEAIETALVDEPDGRVRNELEVARAAAIASDPGQSEEARREAVDRLAEAGSSRARRVLLGMFIEEGSELDARRDAAVEVIDRNLARWQQIQNLWHGVSLGSVLLLAAMGLAITFGVMGVINMAHGEMIMIGAYTTFVVQGILRGISPALAEVSLLIALPVAFLVAGLIGVFIERTVIRRLYSRPLETLLATWGISLILQQLVRTFFGASNQRVETPSWLSGSMEFGQIMITYNRLAILIFALVMLAAVILLLKKTPLGLHIRAVTQNRKMAESMGIRSDRVDMLTFGLGSGIAGVAGVALSQIANVSPNLGQGYIIDSFMVIVFGGVGNLFGTLVGAMTLGITTQLVEPTLGAVAAKVLILVFIIIFIQFRPRGLFPQKGRAAE